jgi:Domain of unknown function (DUF6379)
MFDEDLIAGQRLTRLTRGENRFLSFKIRLPWYRSIYLSCFDRIELSLNGRPQAEEKIFFKLYGTTYGFSDLTKHYSVLWFVLDQAELMVQHDSNLPSDQCKIALTVFFRIPYHRHEFRQVSTCTRALQLEERIAL